MQLPWWIWDSPATIFSFCSTRHVSFAYCCCTPISSSLKMQKCTPNETRCCESTKVEEKSIFYVRFKSLDMIRCLKWKIYIHFKTIISWYVNEPGARVQRLLVWVEWRKKSDVRERELLKNSKTKKDDIFMTDTKTLARKASDPAQRLKNVKFFRRSREEKMCWEFFHPSSYEKLYSHSAIHWSRHISSPGWACMRVS